MNAARKINPPPPDVRKAATSNAALPIAALAA
jgi:hypothetical protein